MIVTCPNCDARYRADEAMIARRGGRVRCAACNHMWTVESDVVELREAVDPEPQSAAPPPEEPKKPHEQIRLRNEQRRRKARTMAEGAAWAGVAACFVVFFAASWIYRADIVRAWPRAANAYALVGAEVNPLGLEVAELTVARGAAAADPALIVEGVVRNITGRDRETAPLAARLLGEDGTVIFSWPVYLESPALPSGGEERFRTTLMELPEHASEVEVVIGETAGAPALPGAAPDDAGESEAGERAPDAVRAAAHEHAPR
jgi:predicted Zn finger-like uncharacterized protein